MSPDQYSDGSRVVVNVDDEKESRRSEAESRNRLHLSEEKSREKERNLVERVDNGNRAVARIEQYQEVLATEPENAEELITALQQSSFEDLRNAQLEKEYGKGFAGKVKAWLAGEYDIKVVENEIKEANRLANIGRKALMTFLNKKNIASAGAIIGLGIISGGVGLASTGVLVGQSVGRLSAEIATSGKELESRKELLEAQKSHWYRLKVLADEYSQEVDREKKVDLANQITDVYLLQSEEAVVKEIIAKQAQFEDVRAWQNKLRSRLQIAGGVVGGGAGVAYEVISGKIAGAIDIDLWDRIKGQDIAHQVFRKNGQWHFLYSQAEKVAGISGGQASHILGEGTAKVAGAVAVEKSISVIATALAGSWIADKVGNWKEKRRNYYQEEKNQKIVENLKQKPSFDLGESVGSQEQPKDNSERKDIRELFEKNKKSFPQIGEVWQAEITDEEKKKLNVDLNTYFFRIEGVDEEAGKVKVILLDPGKIIFHNQVAPFAGDQGQKEISLREMAESYQFSKKEIIENEKPNLHVNEIWLLSWPSAFDPQKLGIDASKVDLDNQNLRIPMKIEDLSEDEAELKIFKPVYSPEDDLVETEVTITLPIDVIISFGNPYPKKKKQNEDDKPSRLDI